MLDGLLLGALGLLHGTSLVILALLFFGTALVNELPSFGMPITAHFAPLGLCGSMQAINNVCQTSAGFVALCLVSGLIAWWGNDIAQVSSLRSQVSA